MLTIGQAKKVTVYTGEDVQHRGEPLYLTILNYLFYHRVSGATVVKGVAGFGAGHHMHTARIVLMSENLPVKIEFVESAERLEAILPKLLQMVGDGLIEIQDTTVVRAASGAEARVAPPHDILKGTAKMMRIFIGDNDRWRGKPLHEALVESLRAHDIAGVTVYRGILGYGAHRRFHQDRRMSLSRDAPIVLSVIDEEAKIRAYLPLLEEMVDEGLVVLSDVDVIKYAHGAGSTPARVESQS